MKVSRTMTTFNHGERQQETRTELTEGQMIFQQDH
jgi:hypothetical protein